MNIEITYTFTDDEIAEAVYKANHNSSLTLTDLKALIYGSQQWINFKEECKTDPSYQWGCGHVYY